MRDAIVVHGRCVGTGPRRRLDADVLLVADDAGELGHPEDLLGVQRRIGIADHQQRTADANLADLAEWQRHCPDAIAWAPAAVRRRPQVKASQVRFDRDLEEQAPEDWSGDLRQTMIRGALGFREVAFLHIASRSLVLTDLIVSVETERAPLATRIYALLSGTRAPGGTPRYLRLILRRRRNEARCPFRSRPES